jgi:hypothetical protein
MSIELSLELEGYAVFFALKTYASSIDWLSVGQKLNELDVLTEQLGVTSLSGFISTTREDVPFDEEDLDYFEQLSELVDNRWYLDSRVLWSTNVQWFVPSQGLVTIRALLGYLRPLQIEKETIANDSQTWSENLKPDYVGVIYELEEMEKILNQGVEENRLFRIRELW